MRQALVVFTIAMMAFGCGTPKNSDTAAAIDADADPGTLPSVPDQAGVVYVGDYIDPMLRWYDITGDHPEKAGEMDLGDYIHDLAVDSVNDILAAAIVEDKVVKLFSLDGPSGGVDEPTALSTISFEHGPYLVQLDPYNDRLYVHTVTAGAGQVQIVDISSPSAPAVLTTVDSPIFGSWSLDAARRILFLYNGSTESLEVYDVGEDTMAMVPGAPIDLRDVYPEENSQAFQAYSVMTDPWSARVFAGRNQGNNSELIAYQYDDFVPGAGQVYSDGASAHTMASLPDAIDLSEDLADRHVPLLFSWSPVPDLRTGEVLLVSAVYGSSGITGGVMHFDSDLGPGGDCDYGDSPFCEYQYWSDSSPLWSLQTDGNGCLDSSRRVFAGSTYTPEAEGSGTMQFFTYGSDGTLTPWLDADGQMPRNGPWAVTVACH